MEGAEWVGSVNEALRLTAAIESPTGEAKAFSGFLDSARSETSGVRLVCVAIALADGLTSVSADFSALLFDVRLCEADCSTEVEVASAREVDFLATSGEAANGSAFAAVEVGPFEKPLDKLGCLLAAPSRETSAAEELVDGVRRTLLLSVC